MLSVEKASSATYYSRLARANYWTKGGEPPGRWFGEPCKRFGLKGIVDPKVFQKLFDGRSPDGKPLVTNTRSKSKEPVNAYDLCFTAPKSYSLLWAMMPRRTRALMQRLLRQAVERTLTELEPEMIFTRRGAKGRRREPGKLMAAIHEHASARGKTPDVNLHLHVVLFNIAFTQNGTGTLDGRLIYKFKMIAGALFRRHLANLIREQLGWSIKRIGSCFEIHKVPHKLLAAFSNRSRQIREYTKQHGRTTAKSAAYAAKVTRPGKTDLTRPELFALWAKRAEEIGYPPKFFETFADKAADQASFPVIVELDDAKVTRQLTPVIRDELLKLLSRKAYVTRRNCRAAALQATIEFPVTSEQVHAALDDLLAADSRFVRLNADHPLEAITTKENLLQEDELLKTLQMLCDRSSITVARDTIGTTMREARRINPDGFAHTQEQVNALAHLLEDGDFKLMNGRPGAGKTVAIKTVSDAWKSQGYKVIGIALSGRAARNLHDKADISAFTIKRMTMELEANLFTKAVRAFDDIRYKIDGYEMFERPTIDHKTVLIVDEASQLDTKTALALTRAVQDGNAKMIWLGDKHQIGSYDIGQPFNHAVEVWKPALLTEIRRQKDPADIQAILDIAHGQPELAVKSFKERGMLSVAEDHQESAKQLIAEWRRSGGIEEPESHQILVTNNRQRIEINKQCQELRRAAGQLSYKSLSNGECSFRVGDQVMFLQNNKSLDVNNGDIGKVTEIHLFRNTITVHVPDREPVEVEIKKYKAITHAYAITIDKSQGSDFENTYLLLGGDRESAELLYTGVSRHRDSLSIYANKEDHKADLSDLISAMKPDRQPKLAIQMVDHSDDTVQPEPPDLRRNIIKADPEPSPVERPPEPTLTEAEKPRQDIEIEMRPAAPTAPPLSPAPTDIAKRDRDLAIPSPTSDLPDSDVKPHDRALPKKEEIATPPLEPVTITLPAIDCPTDASGRKVHDPHLLEPSDSKVPQPTNSQVEPKVVHATLAPIEKHVKEAPVDHRKEEIKLDHPPEYVPNLRRDPTQHSALAVSQSEIGVVPRSEIHEPTDPSPTSHLKHSRRLTNEDSLNVTEGSELNDRTETVLNDFDREVALLQVKERLENQLAEREAERARIKRIDEDKDEMTRAPGRLTPGF